MIHSGTEYRAANTFSGQFQPGNGPSYYSRVVILEALTTRRAAFYVCHQYW